MEQKQNLQIAISGPFEGSFQETVGGLRPLTPQMGECYYLDPADKFLQNLSSRGVPLLLVSTRRPSFDGDELRLRQSDERIVYLP